MEKGSFVTIDFDNEFIELEGDPFTRIKLETEELIEIEKLILKIVEKRVKM